MIQKVDLRGIKTVLTVVFTLTITAVPLSRAEEQKPKYGPKGSPKAIPLALSNDYFRDKDHPAPAFWALISYYIPQTTGGSCFTATLAMTLNAARAHLKKSASDAVLTEKMLWENVDANLWKNQPSEEKYHGQHGIDLDQGGKISEAAFKKYGFNNASISTMHVPDATLTTQVKVMRDLKSLSDKTFIMANFNQQNFTDDADVGHFAPVGAYDELRKRVLILDPDRGSGDLNGYYEPYWVSIDTFVKGMNTVDSAGKKTRGYILVKLGS